MFHTLASLYDLKNKYITFGGTIIYCDDNEVCSVFNNVLDVPAVPSVPAAAPTSTATS
jgi:hypothetical protein